LCPAVPQSFFSPDQSVHPVVVLTLLTSCVKQGDLLLILGALGRLLTSICFLELLGSGVKQPLTINLAAVQCPQPKAEGCPMTMKSWMSLAGAVSP
jgi:hypothetical protein